MTERAKQNLVKYWPIVVGILLVTGTYFAMKSHMSNDTLHKNEDEHVLTDEEYKDVLLLIDHSDDIESIKDEVTELETKRREHAVEYQYLSKEHEDLEDKVSRVHKELKEDINKLK